MDLSAILHSSYAKIESYIRANNIQAFRLLKGLNDGLPVIDLYGDDAVIHIFYDCTSEILQEIEAILKKDFHVKNCFYKDRRKPEDKQFNPDLAPKNKIENYTKIIQENGNKFNVNLSDYLDVGLFLDHRETRKFVQSKSAGKVVLNLFAYTGSFSIYAAKGGAEKTYTVDLSKTYCDFARKNFEINNLPEEKNWIYKMDTFEFLKYAKKKNLKFDIIVIDPPTFSRNKGKSFHVQKNQTELITSALTLLNKDGFIVFSNNYTEFRLHAYYLPPCEIDDEPGLIPPDFMPENDSLPPHHCFIIRLART